MTSELLSEKSEADRYFNGHRVSYQRPSRVGFLGLDVLSFLIGHPWDDRALDFVHSLRPSSIRVVRHNEGETTDAVHWRVTVRLNEEGAIASIEQEVEVGLRTAGNGADLWNRFTADLKERSKQEQDAFSFYTPNRHLGKEESAWVGRELMELDARHRAWKAARES